MPRLDAALAQCAASEASIMRASTGCVLGLGTLLLLTWINPTPVPRVAAQDVQAEAPGAMFQAQCASCHVTPDPRVATDRAFILQLQETA
jgi:mono/diheme cytochrome c family protein